MTSLLVDRIGCLVTNDRRSGDGLLGRRDGAVLVIDDGRVVWVGAGGERPPPADERLDVEGRTVIPGFVDSHSHLVFAGDRSEEFAARMGGRPYRAGGIRATVAATRVASTEVLMANATRLASEALAAGTTTLECKSGYGLTVDDERRDLEVAAAVAAEVTFLGAHVIPPEFAGRGDDYVALVCTTMLDACAPRARWIDVFCERGAFDADQAREVLRAGQRRGLEARVHANQLEAGPGAQLAVEVGAASADHLTHLSAADVEALAGSDVVATLLPGADFSTRSPFADGRRLLDAGATVALASDCNPGTSYTTNLPFCIALAVREMGLSPDEALWAATAGGAAALRRPDVGHLGIGATADLVVLDAPSPSHLAYRPGVPLVSQVWTSGRRRLGGTAACRSGDRFGSGRS